MKNQIRTSLLATSLLCIASSKVVAHGGQPQDRAQDKDHEQTQKVDPIGMQRNGRLKEFDRDGEKDFDRIRDQERDREVDKYYERDEDSIGGKIYGHQLMSMEERNAFRKSLRDAKSDEERVLLRTQHRLQMLERAKARKTKSPE